MYNQFEEIARDTTCPCCGQSFTPPKFVVDLNTNTVAYDSDRWKVTPQLAEFMFQLIKRSPRPVSDLDMGFAIYGILCPDADTLFRRFATYSSVSRRILGSRASIERTTNRGYRFIERGPNDPRPPTPPDQRGMRFRANRS